MIFPKKNVKKLEELKLDEIGQSKMSYLIKRKLCGQQIKPIGILDPQEEDFVDI